MADDVESNSPAPSSEPRAPSPEELAAARRRVFESLPPEVQQNPKIRRDFGIDPERPVFGRRRIGLGTVVETLARPVAAALGMKDCKPCKERKKRWDDRFPLFSVRSK